MGLVSAQAGGRPRLWFLDNLKIALTALVILHHVGQAYGPTGGFWYVSNPERWTYLGFGFWLNASFFMGLFFFISAYFLPGSFDRKGAWPFFKERLIRFGTPLLLFVLIINPIMMFLSYRDFRGGSLPLLQYVKEIYLGLGAMPAGWASHWPDINFGHLWFVEHLLVYAGLYCLWQWITRRLPRRESPKLQPPGDLAILGYAVGLALISLVVRLWFPIDHWIGLLGFIQMEPAHLPQYLSLFLLGMTAYRQNWLTSMPAARGYRWLVIGLGAGAVGFTAYQARFFGDIFGWQPSSTALHLAFTIAEAFVATGLTVGLITLFRERWQSTGPIQQKLSASAYGAYLIHFPVVVACQYAASALPVGPLARFLVAGVVSVILSFWGAHLLRKLPRTASVL